jgi:hypothetical protein
MIASIHLETSDLERLKMLVEPNLLPNSSAFLRVSSGWTHVYFDQFLDDADADDFESVARGLSTFFLTITCFAEFAPAQVKCFQNNLEIPVGTVKLEQPDLSFDDLQALDEAGKLRGYEKLEFEAGKPGLAEFFGRSQDE